MVTVLGTMAWSCLSLLVNESGRRVAVPQDRPARGRADADGGELVGGAQWQPVCSGRVEQPGPVLPVVHRQDDGHGVQRLLAVDDAGEDYEDDGRGESFGAAM